MMKETFIKQAGLMVRLLPHAAAESCFALKGGTAINFFVRDMPRLSVDIDLTYLPLEPRADTLKNISDALGRIRDRISKDIADARVREVRVDETLSKLVVEDSSAQVKIEPNLILRGSVYPSEKRDLVRRAQAQFEAALTINVLSLPDLFGGKICAALDRQHPRDLFDIKLMLENEGLTSEIRKAFVVYWVSHDRPLHEIIDPPRKDMRRLYESHFSGMAAEAIGYDSLIEAREELVRRLNKELSDEERRFAVSIKEAEPQWELLGIPGLDKLPAIQWKLRNIKKMRPETHRRQLAELKKRLGL